MCEAGFGPDSKGFVKEQIVSRGRDLEQLLEFAQTTGQYWRKRVCGTCAGTGSRVRCRKHLLEGDSLRSPGEMSFHRALVTSIAHHIRRYARSFQFEFQDSGTDEDAAALLSAVGWCSGWKVLLSILGHIDASPREGAIGVKTDRAKERTWL